MSHLSPSEFVDLADGALDEQRAVHAVTCEACRAQAAAVRGALQMSEGASAVPEPSPLFWDHLSERVREAVAAEPQPRAVFGVGFRFRPVVSAFAVVVAVFSVALLALSLTFAPFGPATQQARDVRPAAAPDRNVEAPSATGADRVQQPETALYAGHDEVWEVLTAAAEDLQLEEARAVGMALPAAAVDRAVLALSSAELTELGRLLQSEMKRSSN